MSPPSPPLPSLPPSLYLAPIWKVARATSAAPMFFREFENYVDGGVLANNPCQVGLARIENYHLQRGQKLPIALVVSVGSGIYPQEKLGSINAQEYLYFGAHWLRLKDTFHEFRNLVELLSNAVSCRGSDLILYSHPPSVFLLNFRDVNNFVYVVLLHAPCLFLLDLICSSLPPSLSLSPYLPPPHPLSLPPSVS